MNSVATINTTNLPQLEWCFGNVFETPAKENKKTAATASFAFTVENFSAATEPAAAETLDTEFQVKRLAAFGQSFMNQAWA